MLQRAGVYTMLLKVRLAAAAATQCCCELECTIGAPKRPHHLLKPGNAHIGCMCQPPWHCLAAAQCQVRCAVNIRHVVCWRDFRQSVTSQAGLAFSLSAHGDLGGRAEQQHCKSRQVHPGLRCHLVLRTPACLVVGVLFLLMAGLMLQHCCLARLSKAHWATACSDCECVTAAKAFAQLS